MNGKVTERTLHELHDVCDTSIVLAVKPSQAKVLTEGGDLREAQATSLRLVAIPALDRIAGLQDRHLYSNWGICYR